MQGAKGCFNDDAERFASTGDIAASTNKEESAPACPASNHSSNNVNGCVTILQGHGKTEVGDLNNENV
ncbi:hypothetical protein G704_04340 [Escherichia coli HVH 28 (4-0907367)]|nr:hypothetical protein G704_04340 [Escherichia coli HVH 28 (4-0907367)]